MGKPMTTDTHAALVEIDEKELVDEFRAMFGARYPKTLTAKAWAGQHGFSQSYVSDVLAGKRGVAERLAEALGYERRVTFIRIAAGKGG